MLLTLALVMIAVSVWWLRRRRRRSKEAEESDPRKRSREEAMAVGLYQSLDRAMVALGIARSAATPPLRHAVALRHVGHPCSDEIVELTERYLAARFGDEPLEVEERRDFEGRVRALKDSAKSGVLQRAATALAPDDAASLAAAAPDEPVVEMAREIRAEPPSERTPLIEVVEIETDLSDLFDDDDDLYGDSFEP